MSVTTYGKFVENHKVFTAIVPADADNTTLASDVYSMENFRHLTVIFSFGAITAAAEIVCSVQECDDTTPSNSPEVEFTHYHHGNAAQNAATSDQYTRTACGTAGDIPVTGDEDKYTYIVELNVEDFSTASYPYFRCVVTEGANKSTFCSAVCILSEPRYPQAVIATAIA